MNSEHGGQKNIRHLEEAMALITRNRAAFVEQIAGSDQERLALSAKVTNGNSRIKMAAQSSGKRFDRIEERL